MPIPIIHRDSFKIISGKPENVKTLCNYLNNPFLFACPK